MQEQLTHVNSRPEFNSVSYWDSSMIFTAGKFKRHACIKFLHEVCQMLQALANTLKAKNRFGHAFSMLIKCWFKMMNNHQQNPPKMPKNSRTAEQSTHS